MQERTNYELGLTYNFDSGLFLGGSYQTTEYDDVNSLLDYDADFAVFRDGFRF